VYDLNSSPFQWNRCEWKSNSSDVYVYCKREEVVSGQSGLQCFV